MIGRWAIAGIVLWLFVAIAFRFFGQTVFSADSSSVPSLFLTAPLAVGVLTYFALRALRVAQSDRAEAASVIAAIGLVIGVFEVANYAELFPGFSTALRDEFAALMFACFAAVIISGLLSSRVESV